MEGLVMLRIVIKCDAPGEMAQGIKEDLAMYLERFGDCYVAEVKEITPYQMTIDGAIELDPKTGEWKMRQ